MTSDPYILVCAECGLNNGPVSAVRKTKLGYVPPPCSCGHELFKLCADEEIEKATIEQAASQIEGSFARGSFQTDDGMRSETDAEFRARILVGDTKTPGPRPSP